MNEAEKMAKDIAAKLTQVQKKMAEDKAYQRRIQKDPHLLKELGFTPKQISTFRLDRAVQDSCECACAPNKGFGKGCFIPTGDGAVTDP